VLQLGSLFTRFRAASLLFVFLYLAGPASAETLAGTALVEHLRKGGYVLLMRHASAPTTLPDRQSADPENTALERQLDEKGRNSAIAMGLAIKRLEIPVGTVLSSPTYRALETIRLAALGSAKTYPQLGDGGHSMQTSAVANQANWLREKVSECAASGSNTIIVTHMPNIVASFDDVASDLTDGETLVFRPEGNGKSDLVAKIKIEDWPSFAHGQ
jgi:phosphohistidine phosphatase SixA